MLYDHVETYEERIDHLLALRDLQDETGGFMAFIPLPFHPENTVFERRGWTFTSGLDDLKMLAVSRLMLDNIEHMKAYWIMISTPLAQVALHFGANDIQGTVVEEKIAHAAGAVTPTEEKVAELVRVIREAGRIPVQRDTFYTSSGASIDAAPRPRLLHQHVPGRVGALAPPRRRTRCEEVAAVPTELNRLLAARRDRRRQRLEHRVRAQPRALRPAAVALRRLRRRGRVGAARHAAAAAGRAQRSPSRATRRPPSCSCGCSCPTPRSSPEGAEADARLLIGDEALRSAFADPTPHHDLGALWRERTGLPMVFAVWAAQRDCDPERSRALDRALRGAVAEAAEHADLVASAAAERHGFPAGYLARYFEKLRYGFGERERAGPRALLRAGRRARRHSTGVPELRFADTARVR